MKNNNQLSNVTLNYLVWKASFQSQSCLTIHKKYKGCKRTEFAQDNIRMEGCVVCTSLHQIFTMCQVKYP